MEKGKMTYSKQFFLDFVEKMPDDQKKCGVNTDEDGTGSVDLGDFIVHYGFALWKQFQEDHENSCGK